MLNVQTMNARWANRVGRPPVQDISFIICTLNRAESLRQTLISIAESLATTPHIAAELVIVDNGSTDHTNDILDEWCREAAYPVRVIKEARRGLAVARNTAIKEATGRILVFTDDDCCLSVDFTADLMRHYGNDRSPVIRGGRVELGDPRDLPFTIKLEKTASQLCTGTHPGAFVLGCNMTMHRQVIDIVGVFDERFGAGAAFCAGEETDLIYRAHLQGILVEYVPDMTVQHFHGRRSLREIRKLNHGYHVGTGALYAKYRLSHWRLLKHFYWDMRSAFRELAGGSSYDPQIGLSHFRSIAGNLIGAFLYLVYARLPPRQTSPHGRPSRRAQQQARQAEMAL